MGTRNPGFDFGYMQCHAEIGCRQFEEGFSSFLAKFLPYLMNFRSGAYWRCCYGTLKNNQIWQKLKKTLVRLAFNPFFGWFRVPENQISDVLVFEFLLNIISDEFLKFLGRLGKYLKWFIFAHSVTKGRQTEAFLVIFSYKMVVVCFFLLAQNYWFLS